MTNFTIRGWRTQVTEEVVSEGIVADVPLRKVTVAAVIQNPFLGDYVEDLSEAVEWSVGFGAEISRRAIEALAEPVQAYGKGGIAGVNGAQEHVIAFVTTPFGNELRKASGGGAAWISSASIVGAAGTPLTLPLAHKDALYVRDNYDAVTLYPGDAPRPNEIVVAIAVANRGRLNSRLGGISAGEVIGKDGLR
ncbi:amino acid synthesis family protein [Candidatus Poriferisocius sp.]|uniref:amino acid synthesis family protein n=1 Tax=Candidatus Poriferisocius sp. TaxID=3101276 RepID=UPI003B02EC78